MRSKSCIYCGHEPLVRVGHWGICPFCSKDYLDSINLIPAGYALIKRVTPEELERGKPGWPRNI